MASEKQRIRTKALQAPSNLTAKGLLEERGPSGQEAWAWAWAPASERKVSRPPGQSHPGDYGGKALVQLGV